MMTFGSLFSGVGGFDLGLEAAGMRCAWQVEIDPQASSVLRYHWPDVAQHADVRNVGRSNLAPVDLICGGFPCQDLSVAGKRAGLAGERSGLFHEFMRVVDELAPRWVLLENVPGLLSSNGGRDMGTVLGVLGRLGYGFTYRVLDTQYFGPPQRRRRVFIVGRAGGFCPPEVLLEPEGLPWNPAPRREAREGATRGVTGGAGNEGCVAGTLEARSEAGGFPGTDGACAGHVVAQPITAREGKGPASSVDSGNLVVAQPQSLAIRGREGVPQVELGTDGKANALITPNGGRGGVGSGAVLAFDTTQVKSKLNRSNPKPGDPCHPLAAGAHPPAIAFNWQNGGGYGDAHDGLGISQDHTPPLSRSQTPAVTAALVPRRLTPTECERLQGWPDSWTRWGRTESGEVVEIADSPRYRMAGNGVSSPVAEWIGRRIAAHSTQEEP